MDHKIYMNYIHSSTLLRQLSDLWRTDQLCDAVITVDKSIVAKAHKLMMFAVSPKLKAESQSNAQSPILDVKLPSGISHSSVHAFLQYLYEGFLVLTTQIAKDLVEISKYLEINSLLNCCCDFLKASGVKRNSVVLSDLTKASFPGEFSHIRHIAMEGKDIAEEQSVLDDRGFEESENSSDSCDISKKEPSVDRTTDIADQNSSVNQKKRKQSDVEDDSAPHSEKKRTETPSLGHPVKVEETFQSCSYEQSNSAVASESSLPGNDSVPDSVASSSENISLRPPDHEDSSSRDSPEITFIKVEHDENIPEEMLDSFQSFPSDSHNASWYSQDGEYDQSMAFDSGGAPMPADAQRFQMTQQRVPSHTLSSSQQADQQQEYMSHGGQSNVTGDGSTEDESVWSKEESNRTFQRPLDTQPSPAVCSWCNATFNSQLLLQDHMKKHLPLEKLRKYSCPICKKRFQERYHYEGHLNKHKNLKPHVCPFCGNAYSYKTSLNLHVKKCIIRKAPQNSADSELENM